MDVIDRVRELVWSDALRERTKLVVDATGAGSLVFPKQAYCVVAPPHRFLEIAAGVLEFRSEKGLFGIV